MDNDINFETYLFIGLKKIIISVYSESNKIIYEKILLIEDDQKKLDFDKLDHFLNENIFKIEKLIKNFINKIFIILNVDEFLSIELSIKSAKSKGGPFGCVIVKDDKIIAEGHNQVTANNDPTAHAEIVAIRNACKKLKNFFLKGCDLYTSCEPCPMCLSAIYWSHVDNIFYANTRMDAKDIDFDDSLIYSEINKKIKDRKIKMKQMNRDKALEAFKIWQNKQDKIKY